MREFKILRYSGLSAISEVWSGTSLEEAHRKLDSLGYGYLLVEVLEGK